jgi:hypothetical protein
MVSQHPILPPPELLQLWFEQHYAYNKGLNEVLIEVSQWGADAELEACCTVIEGLNYKEAVAISGDQLRASRRPKPPSLKEQALEQLREVNAMLQFHTFHTTGGETSVIRRALEALPE